MNYSVMFSQEAEKDVKKLNSKTRERIKQKLHEIKEFPEHYVKWIKIYRLFSMRVGDYRVFIDLDHEKKIIHVITILHRRLAYKP